MRVSAKFSMEEYDAYTHRNLIRKIPVWDHRDRKRRLGDSIYDFSQSYPRLRQSVHTPANVKTDLSGGFVLASDHYFYFGSRSVPLPSDLLPIVKQGQGHRRSANAPYLPQFEAWIHTLGLPPNTVLAHPQLDLFADPGLCITCAEASANDDKEDVEGD
ncbi:MAG: hypothetical protein EXR52_08265 [Dehalococcoidia bacterium]|nr:hypothetical protein [Dehalococcoidia bacterium]